MNEQRACGEVERSLAGLPGILQAAVYGDGRTVAADLAWPAAPWRRGEGGQTVPVWTP
ncbi:hypothetical protein ACFQNE_14190 [Gordonia phosphorivorans]|uniref:Uncharacterized protein n=1 Tax=Gordonia phosphorivorans TaxID=1056982 RepID=A0ABV6H7N4_9ACTN